MNDNPKILADLEVNNFISNNSSWSYLDDSLQANYEFSDFDDAMRIVEMVADKSREMNHHPFWSNEYNKLSFILSTHEAGNKITKKDLELAKAISEIIAREVG